MNFKLRILGYLIGFKLSRWLCGHNWAALRQRRFRRLVRHLRQSPFYGRFVTDSPHLSDFPVMSKKVFMENFEVINTCQIKLEEAYAVALQAEESRDFSPTINGITVGLSSGTSGSRGIFLASEAERARWVACVLDRVIGFSLRKRKVAFFLRANSNLYSSAQSGLLAFHFCDLLQPIADHIRHLQYLQPHLLVAQPSMLLEIAKAIERQELTLFPEKIISVAEVLTPEDQRYLSRIFRQTIHQVYQCTEGFLAYTCKYGILHFNEDFLYIEKKYIDSEQQRFHPIITDLMRITQPVIRYELNDILLEQQNCLCGSTWLGIAQIEGRADDILVFESEDQTEIKIFPDFFRKAIITSSKDIEAYALIQRTKKQLDLFIQSSDPHAFDLASRAIHTLLEKHRIRGVQIYLTYDKGHQAGQKLRRIKNDRQKAD